MRLRRNESACLGAIMLSLAAAGTSAGQGAADLLAASTPAGTVLVLESDVVRVHAEALTYPRAERATAESRPVVLYVKVVTASRAESMTLLDAPPGGRLSWRAGAVPRGVRIEILKAPPSVSTMRNPEADPPTGSTVEAEWDGGRLVLAAFDPMHLGEGTGPSPSVTVFLSDGVIDVSHNGVRRRMAVRAGDAFWLEARTGVRVVSDHVVGAAIVQLYPGRWPAPRSPRRDRIDMHAGRGHHGPVLTRTFGPLFLAQALVERGLLDQISAGLSSARYQLELFVGQGNTIYVIIGVVLLLVLTRVRRRY